MTGLGLWQLLTLSNDLPIGTLFEILYLVYPASHFEKDYSAMCENDPFRGTKNASTKIKFWKLFFQTNPMEQLWKLALASKGLIFFVHFLFVFSWPQVFCVLYCIVTLCQAIQATEYIISTKGLRKIFFTLHHTRYKRRQQRRAPFLFVDCRVSIMWRLGGGLRGSFSMYLQFHRRIVCLCLCL